MYTTELIKTFPATPDRKIVYVVYNEDTVPVVEMLIENIWGKPYLKQHVTVIPYREPSKQKPDPFLNSVYIDPGVYLYKHQWND